MRLAAVLVAQERPFNYRVLTVVCSFWLSCNVVMNYSLARLRSTPWRTRTPDVLFRKQLFYPLN